MKASLAVLSYPIILSIAATAALSQNLPVTPASDASAIEPAPSPELKADVTGITQPVTSLKQLPRYILEDQGALWKSPFQMNRNNAKWWLLFGSLTGGLLASDHWTAQQLSHSPGQVSLGTGLYQLGAGYTLYPASFGLYLLGNRTDNEHLSETGLLGLEALANGFIVSTALKAVFSRQRPLDGNGGGNFFSRGGGLSKMNASFPSGHAIESWALASIIAHEYPHPIYIPVLAYGGATGVLLGRFLAQKHFASDVVLGAGIGWFIGHYVYDKHHDPGFESSKFKAFLSNHVDFGQ